MMNNPQDMTLAEWQEAVDTYRQEAGRGLPVNQDFGEPPIAMRIENTQLSIARHYGGITFRGHAYTYFEPLTGWRNADGSPEVAWLVVRDDLLRWVDEKRKGEALVAAKAKREAKAKAEAIQGRLFG